MAENFESNFCCTWINEALDTPDQIDIKMKTAGILGVPKPIVDKMVGELGQFTTTRFKKSTQKADTYFMVKRNESGMRKVVEFRIDGSSVPSPRMDGIDAHLITTYDSAAHELVMVQKVADGKYPDFTVKMKLEGDRVKVSTICENLVGSETLIKTKPVESKEDDEL